MNVCKSKADLGKLEDEQEWSQPYWPKIEKAEKSNCRLPCTTTNYDFEYSFINVRHPGLNDLEADFVITLWFKNFRFEYSEEYVVCDWTCLVGEVGGNFGFFLGGSVLAVFDLFVVRFVRFVQ